MKVGVTNDEQHIILNFEGATPVENGFVNSESNVLIEVDEYRHFVNSLIKIGIDLQKRNIQTNMFAEN
jgi:hypothetical protein